MNDSELTGLCADICLGTPGVSGLSGTIYDAVTDTLKSIPGMSGGIKGVKLARDKGQIVLDVYLRVYFGENIPMLSWNVQSSIKSALSENSKDPVKEINVHVQGVDKKGEEE